MVSEQERFWCLRIIRAITYREEPGEYAHSIGWSVEPGRPKPPRRIRRRVSTPERNCIGGRRKNTSRAEIEVWPSQVCGSQTQLSSSIVEPAVPSRPGLARARRAG